MPVLRQSDLDEFVVESDRLGGPGAKSCTDYWSSLAYEPTVVVDQSLDSLSEEYVAQQLALYTEISARQFDQSINEHVIFDLEAHAGALNAYNHGSPSGLSMHVERLSRAIRLGDPPRGGGLLDMGCGWGLSSEVAAHSGLNVTSVDVNAEFVELVNRRAAKRQLPIHAIQGTFDTFESPDRYSMILFYECLHHAQRPWDVLERMVGLLEPQGKIVLAGEPINDYWWKHWGMRLDPLSLYCVRKFGWFESGWSLEFLRLMFRRAGLSFFASHSNDGDIGITVVGAKANLEQLGARDIGKLWKHDGWFIDASFLTSKGVSSLDIELPLNAKGVLIRFMNFRGRPMPISFQVDHGKHVSMTAQPGANLMELAMPGPFARVDIKGEAWVPGVELKNGDMRRIGIHLESVTFVY